MVAKVTRPEQVEQSSSNAGGSQHFAEVAEWFHKNCRLITTDVGLMRQVYFAAREPKCHVLITGDTGTGKEIVAEDLRRVTAGRDDNKYQAVNCALLRPDLAHSILFGHAKGAFTGATREELGVFGRCDGGTVFLDEIHRLEPTAMNFLLRYLETGEVEPLGLPPRKVDVRVMAACALSKKNELPLDLWYRLRQFPVDIPPLSATENERWILLHRFFEEERVTAMDFHTFAFVRLHRWPGNGRELRNFCRNLSSRSVGGKVALLGALRGFYPCSASLPEDLEEFYLNYLFEGDIARSGDYHPDAFRVLHWATHSEEEVHYLGVLKRLISDRRIGGATRLRTLGVSISTHGQGKLLKFPEISLKEAHWSRRWDGRIGETNRLLEYAIRVFGEEERRKANAGESIQPGGEGSGIQPWNEVVTSYEQKILDQYDRGTTWKELSKVSGMSERTLERLPEKYGRRRKKRP